MIMKFLTSSISLPLLLGIALFPVDFAIAGRFGGGGVRSGGGANTRVNLQNRGNVSNFNRPTNVNVQNRPGINQTINVGNKQINKSGTINRNISGNTVNINNNINRNSSWYAGGCRSNCWGAGGGWYGRGYYVPPAWGLATFGTGLAIGAALSTPPPNYTTVVVSGSEYLYSDGIYVQPSGNNYIVMAPPVGAVVTYLPDGCTATNSNGVQYFECSGVVYQPFYQNGDVVFQVVSAAQG
jgi:hypothetical protein